MEAIARKRFIRQSPYKIRFVLKTIKGMNVNNAINKLSLTKNDNNSKNIQPRRI